MDTKYILRLGSQRYELDRTDLKNWDEVKCTYKRADYDGVVRSFTSKFEFVNHARDLLLALYHTSGFSAEASLIVQTMTDRWTYERRFECPLDFSTIEWEGCVLRIGAVDNSLAALIKANKGTKYEYAVGSEIKSMREFKYDRMLMEESATYGLTQGDSITDSPDIIVDFPETGLPWIGLIESEVAVNGVLYFVDDQNEEDTANNYLLKATKDCSVKITCDISYRSDLTTGGTFLFVDVANAAGTITKHKQIGGIAASAKVKISATAVADLPELESLGNRYAVIDGTVWVEGYHAWEDTYKTEEEYFTSGVSYECTLDLSSRETVSISCQGAAHARIRESKILVTWYARGDEFSVPAIRPAEAARRLLASMVKGRLNGAGNQYKVGVYISSHDSRIANTWLLASESIRGIPGAKFYSSFTEFCDWMSAVFGYVYYIGRRPESEYAKEVKFGKTVSNPYELQESYTAEVNTANIYFDSKGKRFFYVGGSGYYRHWPGDSDYVGTDGYPPDNVIYTDEDNKSYVFPGSGARAPEEYDINEWNNGTDDTAVVFVHRSELFGDSATKRVVEHVRDVSCSVEASRIYSTIEAGYDKQEYENTNGRYEFNFDVTYTTGCTLTDRKLSLKSKYRADCYGIEFAAQERNKDSTDTKSDKDVFFVLCQTSTEGYVTPDKTMTISNARSEDVFNAAFSPMACVRANAGLIAMQAGNMELTFASSTGNSEIVIDGASVSDSITVSNPIATCAILQFTTDDVGDIADVSALIELQSDGIVYRGFLQEVDIKYARAEAAKYKLILKEFEI